MSTHDGLTMGIARVDLADGSWGIIYENSGFHSVMYLAGIDALLIGLRTLPDGSTPPLGLWVNLPGLSFSSVLLKTDGSFIRGLGTPPGYIAWLPATGQMVSNCPYDYANSRHLPERPTGNMVVFASLDWDAPRVIDTPDHLCFHIARSRCERYVVSEAYRAGQGIHGPLDIVVANVRSGKHRVLVEDCGTHASGAAWRCACPYFTSDNRHVIYNADPGDITHVYAARIPVGFLESLE